MDDKSAKPQLIDMEMVNILDIHNNRSSNIYTRRVDNQSQIFIIEIKFPKEMQSLTIILSKSMNTNHKC